MASKLGPRIVTDNLVLALDCADAKSYAGEPTTNLLLYPESINSGPTQESWSGTITQNAVIAPDGTLTATKIEATSGYVYEVKAINTNYNSVSFGVGDTITYSVWIKMLDGTQTASNGPYIWNYNSPTYGIVARDLSGLGPDWKLYKMSYTVQSHQTSFAISYSASNGGVTGTYAIWHPQLEVKSYNTPYVKVSRSATDGWVDLSGNSNDGTLVNGPVTSASHYRSGDVILPNSARYLEFDGSNDKADCGSVTPDTGDFTIEFIYQLTGNGGRGGLFERKAGSPYNGFSLGQGGSGNWAFTVSGTSNFSAGSYLNLTWTYPALNTWYHDVGVYSGGNSITIYRNGLSVSSTSGTTQGNLSTQGTRTNFLIANRDNSTSLPCKVGLVRVYNKALTAAEILNNYNSTKSRFS